NAEPCEYQISQRADFLETEVGLETMHSRPIVNTRDEPHADPEKYRRLHVIVGDANMSEVSTYLKVGTMAIVLSMVEDDFIEKDLSIDGPVAAFRKVSRDLACRDTVRLKGGRTISAVDHQREFLALAKRYFKERQQPEPCVADVMGRWGATLDRLAEDARQLGREPHRGRGHLPPDGRRAHEALPPRHAPRHRGARAATTNGIADGRRPAAQHLAAQLRDVRPPHPQGSHSTTRTGSTSSASTATPA